MLGKLKNEYSSKPLAKFVRLHVNMYSVKATYRAEHKKAKGIAERRTEIMVHDYYMETQYEERTSKSVDNLLCKQTACTLMTTILPKFMMPFSCIALIILLQHYLIPSTQLLSVFMSRRNQSIIDFKVLFILSSTEHKATMSFFFALLLTASNSICFVTDIV